MKKSTNPNTSRLNTNRSGANNHSEFDMLNSNNFSKSPTPNRYMDYRRETNMSNDNPPLSSNRAYTPTQARSIITNIRARDVTTPKHHHVTSSPVYSDLRHSILSPKSQNLPQFSQRQRILNTYFQSPD